MMRTHRAFLVMLGLTLLLGSIYIGYKYFTRSTLRRLAASHDLQIGVAVSGGYLNNPEYSHILRTEFSIITPENAMKFGVLSSTPGEYNFEEADLIVSFAQNNHILVRGHTLVWSNQLPEWLTNGQWTRQQLIDILHTHIQTVVSHFAGKIYAWDVVNEAVARDGTIAQDNFWYRGIGPDYIEMAFQWAHEADPDALLFYNDVYAEDMGEKSDGVYLLVSSLLSDGIAVHGIGLEMHTGLGWSPTADQVAENIQRLGELGLLVHITEMDVRLQVPTDDASLEQQAQIYSEITAACLSQPNCDAIVFWGLSDAQSWIPQAYPGWGAALIFDEDYQPKPAYFAIQEQLQN